MTVPRQLALDFSGAHPLSQVLERKRVIRAKRDASLRQAATVEAEMAAKDAEMTAKKAAIREALKALVGEERFREIMGRYGNAGA